MAAPASYTETALADYMKAVLGPVATALGWTTTPDDYQEAVNETLLMYGVDAIGDVSGRASIQKLRAFARVQVWVQVVAAVSGDFDFEADGGRYDRSQMQEMALENLSLAESAAMAYGYDGYQVAVDKLRHVHDPYAYVADDDRVRP